MDDLIRGSLRNLSFGTPGNPVVKQRSREVDASRIDSHQVTQKVNDEKKHSDKMHSTQGFPADIAEPNKIRASTSFDRVFNVHHFNDDAGAFPVKPSGRPH
jgi:hypothetical protein